MSSLARTTILLLAAGVFAATAGLSWHGDPNIRRGTAIVVATLIFWVGEVAPLGVVAMGIPLAAVLTRVLTLNEALAVWGDPILFLFLGAFLLARAMERHGAFEWLLANSPLRPRSEHGATAPILAVLLVSGVISTVQNNTAVAAMLLPIVTGMARRHRYGAALLLALSFGATFGGLATPVGTAPNFIGYTAMKQADATVSFVTWMRVGVPAWIGTTLIGWGVLRIAARRAGPATRPRERLGLFDDAALADVGPAPVSSVVASSTSPAARNWALAACLLAAVLWLIPGIVVGAAAADSPWPARVRLYLPESLVPIALAWVLFLVRVGPERRPVLDRHDFQALDWDTLFLIAGGLCLGKVLGSSGAAAALARGVACADLPPAMLMVAVAGTTVLLSELTSNTATASLMVPIAASLAPAMGASAVSAIWLVALASSLGFALPVSTPPNALVYGTRLVPLRFMVAAGLTVDMLSTGWIVLCVRWLA